MFNENNEYLIGLLNDIRKEDRIDVKIRGTLMMMKILYPEKNPHINNVKKKLEKLNKDKTFRRKTQYKNTILNSQEDALLYYGENYHGDYDYVYDEEMEAQYMDIEKLIDDYLAWAYRTVTTADAIDL